MNKDIIQDCLKRLVNELVSNYERRFNSQGGNDYALGYMESFMADVLTAYVPANMRHELVTMLDMRISSLVGESEETNS